MNAVDQIDWAAVEQRLRKGIKPSEIRPRVLEPLVKLLPATQALVGDRVVPRLNKYIPITPTARQAEFLSLDVKDAFYGGAAGGGKSIALLAAAAQFVDVPGYEAVIIRKNFAQLTKPSALMSVATDWWTTMAGVERRDGGREYSFDTGPGNKLAKVTFGHLESSEARRNYQSAQYAAICIDEVTDFLEGDFRFLFSRLRQAPPGVPLRMRSGSNPNGPGRLWVKERYVDPVTRGNRAFIPAQIDDNDYLLNKEDYKRQLAEELGPVEAAQLLRGDWDAQATGKFRRHWFKLIAAVPSAGRFVRYWDLAATEKKAGNDPSYTAGVLLGCTGREYFIADIVRERLTPKGVEDLVTQTAQLDGAGVRVRMEQEPGSAGVNVIAHYATLLAGYDFSGDKVTGPRDIRANAFASQAEAGNVFLVLGAWNKVFLDETEIFPGGGHDDAVVAASGAFNTITGVPAIDPRGIMLVGNARLKPDW